MAILIILLCHTHLNTTGILKDDIVKLLKHVLCITSPTILVSCLCHCRLLNKPHAHSHTQIFYLHTRQFLVLHRIIRNFGFSVVYGSLALLVFFIQIGPSVQTMCFSRVFPHSKCLSMLSSPYIKNFYISPCQVCQVDFSISYFLYSISTSTT